MQDDPSDDEAIRAIIHRQFASLSWSRATEADWDAFLSDFAPTASLYPVARPAQSQTPDAFVTRMKGLAAGTLQSFQEAVLGCDIRIFGNVAVAVAGCQMTENNSAVNRGVEMMLLVKSDGRWSIVSQAWDTEQASRPIPLDLCGG